MKTDDILEQIAALEEIIMHRLANEHRAAMTCPDAATTTRAGTCKKCSAYIGHERAVAGLSTCVPCQRIIENEDSSNGLDHYVTGYRKTQYLAFSNVELYNDDEPEEFTEI